MKQWKKRTTKKEIDAGWKSEETLGGQISISFSREKASSSGGEAEIQLGKADIITDDAVVDTRRGRQARTDPTDLSRRSVTRHHFIYRRVRRVARCRRALPTPRASEEEGSSGRAAWPSKEGPILVDTSPIRLENYADATEFPPPPLDALPILTSFTTLDISDDRWIKKKFCSNRAFFDYETNTRTVQLCRLLSSLVTGSHVIPKLIRKIFPRDCVIYGSEQVYPWREFF